MATKQSDEFNINDLPYMYGQWLFRSMLLLKLMKTNAPRKAITFQRSLIRATEEKIQHTISGDKSKLACSFKLLSSKEQSDIQGCEEIRTEITKTLLKDPNFRYNSASSMCSTTNQN